MSEKEKEMPSEEFQRAVSSSMGTIHAVCELCKRVHFASYGGGDWEEGELEKLQEGERKDPDKYIDHGDGSVSLGYIEGKQVVLDCPCGKLKKYEDWIWNHSDLIAQYLVFRAEKEAKEAQDNLQQAKECEKAVKIIDEISARNKVKRAKLAKEAEARIMELGKREICLNAPNMDKAKKKP